LLLRDLSSDEKAAYEASKKLEREISLLRTKLVNEKDPDNYKIKADQLEQLEKDHQVLPWNADKKKYPPTIVVPVHLKELARRQVPRWIQSAINAALVYKKGCHYDVHDGKIVPVDYDNTGVWQHNMVWSNGLAQFLQIKEGLKVSPENICTNFISTVGFFRRYAQRLYGLTGTLGNETTQEFFKKVYNTDLVIVPPYKQRLIVGNADSRYACKELTPQIITNKDINKWYDAIEASALQHAQQQRAVLIICKYICQVHALEERLQRRYTKDKIFTYTGKKKFTKGKVYPGEVVIATNIAGRGTDLTLDALVEHHGGLHVCITFLPESYRVELQNAGRTARQGSKGTTQLILHQPEAVAIAALRQQRDEQEAEDLQKAIDEVKRMTFKDELFQGFCRVENKLIPTLDSFERMRQSQLLKQLWEAYTQDSLSSALIADRYERHVDNCVQTQIDAIPATQWSSLSPAEKQVQKATIAQAVRTENSFSEFQQIYTLNARKKALQKFQKELGDSHTLHRDVVTAFEEGREYIPENGALAVKHGWGPHERKAVEERFGLWFHKHVPQGKEPIDVDKIRTAFKEFIQEIEADAQANNLIHNPFFYVQKGNYLLQSSVSSTAIAAYDKAIALDPDFSLHARYNKAMALLEPEENKHRHSAAKEELQEAKLLVKQYRDSLFIFQGILGLVQPPKPQTAQHLQHHLDILFQQDNHIDAAIGVITSAQDEGNHVKITKRTEVDALFDEDAAQEHREQALAESYENGLAYFFTIEEKKPRPWLAICVVALIGLVQIAAATLATVGTAGLVAGQLLKSGISDIVTAISSAISGKFSWREWGISKAISVGISIFGIAKKLEISYTECIHHQYFSYAPTYIRSSNEMSTLPM
jgi:tetratricopeptide (TPR) repeat protein